MQNQRNPPLGSKLKRFKKKIFNKSKLIFYDFLWRTSITSLITNDGATFKSDFLLNKNEITQHFLFL